MDYYTAAIAQAGFPKVNAAEIQSIYREELRKMAPLEREVFLASRREGLSRREIAESFGISENTVRYLLSKVLSALRVALSDYLDTP